MKFTAAIGVALVAGCLAAAPPQRRQGPTLPPGAHQVQTRPCLCLEALQAQAAPEVQAEPTPGLGPTIQAGTAVAGILTGNPIAWNLFGVLASHLIGAVGASLRRKSTP